MFQLCNYPTILIKKACHFPAMLSRVKLAGITAVLGMLSVAAPLWAAPGSYDFTFRGAAANNYIATPPSVLACPAPGGGTASNPLAGAQFSNATPSLSPEELGLGQIVAFEVQVEVNGSISPENGVIQFKTGFGTKTSNNSDFGFDSAFGTYCAFVDTSDSSNLNLDGDETVSILSSTVVGDEIQGTIQVSGLDDDDRVIIEVWMVLDNQVPQSVGGTIANRIVSAQTGSGANINTGNKNVPINQLGNFFNIEADLSVQKSDTPDPVELLANLTYAIEVKNLSSTYVANTVALSDTLDPDTQFVSAVVTDTTGFVSTCSHNGAAAGGTISCTLGFLETSETVSIAVTTKVLSTADAGSGGTGPCTGAESLCNSVTISSINDNTASNNTASQPTGVVINGPFAALLVDKDANFSVAYAGTPVTYTYTVTNPASGGFQVLSVAVSDDKCSPVSFVGGDTDADSKLDTNETWTYTCQATLNVDTTNTGTVTGTDDITGLPLQNTNQYVVNIINPALSIDKTAAQPTVITGGTASYTYTVTNPGDDPLANVTVTDDKCSPVVFSSGDTNGNSLLDTTESWTFTCSTALAVNTTNTAWADGTDSAGNPVVSPGDSVTVTIDDCPADPAKTAPGICGCGVSDADTDGDGVADCNDLCPADGTKNSPGICGCGIADTDSDADGAADCNDLCPNNAPKTAPGVCGCAVADTDSDSDGTPDCNDGCPNDSTKLAGGQCGCGIADTDSDNDGTADCNDLCPNDASKVAAGICGCGVADTDSDSDGTADCNDLCPNDATKLAAGICGCGVADTDSDSDGTADCNDLCPNNAPKTAPGVCGCAVADSDSDSDGTPDCNDGCPNDSTKLTGGQCGCGVAETDSDNDGTADCNDLCPNDASKLAAGTCGCGVADTDSDQDGTADCNDQCSADAGKTAPGICGCGVADTDSDQDGTADCNDQCSADSGKTAPGICGCGVSDADSDSDGTADCNDVCPADSGKTAAGICGCGVADVDKDGDGTADCNDACVDDASKTAPGICGCGTADTDADSNGVADCLCQSIDLSDQRGDLLIGPEQLLQFSNKTLKRLTRNANKVSKALGLRLKKSSKSANRKLQIFITEANQSLDQLPAVVLVCPDSPQCASVDNTNKILVYQSAIFKLSNEIIRTLNRATRLVFPSPKLAKKNTKGFGKTVRGTRDSLVARAQTLPKTQSFCAQ